MDALTGPQTAWQRFGACLAGGGEADLLIIMDESGSLLDTDPQAARVTSANYFLGTLAGYTDRTKASFSVSAIGFGHQVNEVLPWTQLSAKELPNIQKNIDQFRNRTDGIDTDYWLALDGARKNLAERRAQTPQVTRCQAIVMFSDGKFDVMPRPGGNVDAYGGPKPYAKKANLATPEGAAEAMKHAQTDMCRAGGLADNLGTGGIAMFGIGLAPPGTPESDFEFLRSIITGRGAGGSGCGGQTTSRGDFALASDIDGLLFAFDAISNPGKPPLQQTAGICGGAFCEEQSHRFVLDISTPAVRILATSDRENIGVALRLPDMTPIDIPPAPPGKVIKFAKYGMEGTATWQSARTIEIEFQQKEMNLQLWQGLWQFAFVDGAKKPGTSRTNVHLSGALTPVWEQANEVTLRAGEVTGGQVFRLGFAGGETFEAKKLLGSMQFSGTIVDGAGKEHPIFVVNNPKKVGQPQRIDLSSAAPGVGRVELRLDTSTAPVTTATGKKVDGTKLEPSLVTFPVEILAPANYPLPAEAFAFDPGNPAEGIEGTLTFSGDGCAWIDPTLPVDDPQGPAGIGQLRVCLLYTSPSPRDS